MTTNKLTNWKIFNNSINYTEYFVDSVFWGKQGLIVEISDLKNNSFKIIWNNDEVLSYRNSYELYFSYGSYNRDENIEYGITFFRIENSDYIKDILKWAYPEFINEQLILNLNHYSIYTVDICVDVICVGHPTMQNL